MKSYLNSLGLAAIGLALSIAATPARAVTVTVDTGAAWNSYQNAFNPANTSEYRFGFPYNIALNTTTFNGNEVTLQAMQVNPGDPINWFVGGVAQPGAVGINYMESLSYIQPADGTYTGVNFTFEGTVLSNTLVSGYTAQAFIRDFAPDYSSFNSQSVDLTPGNFSVTLATVNDPGRHLQYGFAVYGLNIFENAGDLASKGAVVVTSTAAVPEPASFATIAGGMIALFAFGSRRRVRA